MIGSRNKVLFMELARQIKDVLKESVRQIIVYGSRARGDFHEDSDLDIIVLVDIRDSETMVEQRRKMNLLASRFGLEHDIMISISVKQFDLFEFQKEYLPFYRNVINEGIQLYG